MTVLITGANGQLGNEMRIVTSGRTEDFVFSDVLFVLVFKMFVLGTSLRYFYGSPCRIKPAYSRSTL